LKSQTGFLINYKEPGEEITKVVGVLREYPDYWPDCTGDQKH